MTGAEIQVKGLQDVGDGIVFAPQEGSKREISNVFVTHMAHTGVSGWQQVLPLRGQPILPEGLVRVHPAFTLAPGRDCTAARTPAMPCSCQLLPHTSKH